jgi:hypothetical protein
MKGDSPRRSCGRGGPASESGNSPGTSPAAEKPLFVCFWGNATRPSHWYRTRTGHICWQPHFMPCPVADLSTYHAWRLQQATTVPAPSCPGYALGGLLHRQSEAGPFVVDQRLVALAHRPLQLILTRISWGLGWGNIDLGHWGCGGVAATLAHGWRSA